MGSFSGNGMKNGSMHWMLEDGTVQDFFFFLFFWFKCRIHNLEAVFFSISVYRMTILDDRCHTHTDQNLIKVYSLSNVQPN